MKKGNAEIRIRYLTADLHRKLKVRAALDSKTLNQTILDALLAYVKSSPKESI
jgi:plasmid stability protein